MEFAAIVFMVVLVIMVQRFIYDRLPFRRFDYRCFFTKNEVTEGDEVGLVEQLENRKWLPLPWLKSELITSKWLEYADSQSDVSGEIRFVPSFFVVKSFQRISRNWHVNCTKRGVFQIRRVDLVCTDLLGFSSRSNPVPVQAKLTVLPRTWKNVEGEITPRYLSGETVVKRQLVDDPFFLAGVQEYTGREPVNRICWPATAKTGKLMVYTKHYTAQKKLTIALNTQLRPDREQTLESDEQLEDAIRFSAYLFEQTLKEQTPFCFCTNGVEEEDDSLPLVSPYAWGEEHILTQKRVLARLVLKSVVPFSTFLQTLPASIAGDEIVIVSAYLDDNIRQYARAMFRLGVTVKIYIAGPLMAADYSDEYMLCSLYPAKKEGTA